ncbi:MAG: hypothetical protein OEY43_00700 [Gammaproteobacteria bacterium]|nr:hypothetical protein [Gammaproteobacteria bacterium]
MYLLKHKLSEYGFESRENYDYAIQCFMEQPTDNIRYLNVDGDPGRRKSAFANALGQALEYEHLLYFEFGVEKPAPQVIRLNQGEELPEEPPTLPFDRIMTEACALSEAEKTILILDQLHLAEFRQHIRLYEFAKSKSWSYSDVSFFANAQNLLIFIISGEPLYHSLQQASFRIWISALPDGAAEMPHHSELGLDDSCQKWCECLNELLTELALAPSLTELKQLAYDVDQHVRTEEQLKISLFGWIEHVDRHRLNSQAIRPYLARVVQAVAENLGVHEEIEISTDL